MLFYLEAQICLDCQRRELSKRAKMEIWYALLIGLQHNGALAGDLKLKQWRVSRTCRNILKHTSLGHATWSQQSVDRCIWTTERSLTSQAEDQLQGSCNRKIKC